MLKCTNMKSTNSKYYKSVHLYNIIFKQLIYFCKTYIIGNFIVIVMIDIYLYVINHF